MTILELLGSIMIGTAMIASTIMIALIAAYYGKSIIKEINKS